MTTPDQKIARARTLLAGIKAEFEKGTPGKWGQTITHKWIIRGGKRRVCECQLPFELPSNREEEENQRIEEALANARLIAASHNAMPTALEDIDTDLRYAEALLRNRLDTQAEALIERKLDLLESMAREFGVEVEPNG